MDTSKGNPVIVVGCVHAGRLAEGKSQKQQTEAVPDSATWGVPLPHLLPGIQPDYWKIKIIVLSLLIWEVTIIVKCSAKDSHVPSIPAETIVMTVKVWFCLHIRIISLYGSFHVDLFRLN